VKINLFRTWSLKTKMTLFTLITFLIGLWSLSFYAERMLRQDMQHLLGAQQFSTVSILADQINKEVEDRLKAMHVVAGRITPAMINNPALLQTYLESRAAFPMMFSGGFYVNDARGITIADFPRATGRIGIDYSDRPWTIAALKGKTAIGGPITGRKLKVPVFSMATPVFGHQDKVIGALVGITDLSKPNFLDKVTVNSYGKSGGYLLCAVDHKLFMTGTDRSLIMEPFPPAGANPLFDRYLRGYEGSGIVTDTKGVEVLSSAKRIPSANWLLVARMPTEEAFAPIYTMQRRMLIATIILTLLAGGLTWWILRRQLEPVMSTIKILSGKGRQSQPLPVTRQDEIGEMLVGFNRLLKRLREQEQSLRSSEERFRSLFESMVEGVCLHELVYDDRKLPADYRIIEVNPAYAEHTGITREEAVGKTAKELYKTDIPPYFDLYLGVVESGKSTRFETYFEQFAKHFDISVFALGKNGFATVFEDITQRREAEEKLHKSEHLYRMLFENMKEGFCVTQILRDKNGNPEDYIYMEVNPAFADIIGKKREQIVGRHLKELTPNYSRVWFDLFKSVAITGTPVNTEIFSDAFNKYFKVIAYRPLEKQFAALIEDVTERKRMEYELQKTNEKFSKIFSLTPVAVSIVDYQDNSRFINVNEAFMRMTGYPAEEVVGRTPIDLNFYTDLAERKKIRALIAEKGRVSSLEHSFRKKNGDIGRALLSFDFIEIDHKTCGIVTNVDITELENLAVQYKNIFDNAVVGIAQSTPDGRYINVNLSYARMFGYDSPKEMIDHVKDIFAQVFVKPEQRQEYIRLLQEQSGVENFEMESYRRDGGIISVSVTTQAVRDAYGKILHVVSFVKDITELKSMGRQLIEAQKMEAIGTLAGGIAHDFNNILGAIIGYAEMAAEENDEKERKDSIGHVLNASERAKNLIRQILSFSRHAEGEKKFIDFRLIVKESLKLLSSTIPSTIEIRKSISEKNCIINADPTQMHQILMNLCTNAVQAMGEKGGILDVSLSCETMAKGSVPDRPDLRPGPYIRLTVSDTGCGIEPDILNRIFDPFFTTKPVGEGTGLGLSVVYGIVENHNGIITVSGKPDDGTVFSIYIPCAEEKISVPKESIPRDAPRSRGGEKILFIDDEQELARIAARMLTSLGYGVTTFTNSAQALDAIFQTPDKFNLVITDMTMPNMTGKDLAAEVLKLNANMPIIICTGYSKYLDAEKARQIGIKAVLAKPFSKQDLAKVVRETLDVGRVS